MTTFNLDEDEFQQAVGSPYYGCRNPTAAAFGRLAEPFILAASAVEYNFEICTVDGCDGERVPTPHAARVLRQYCHDGLVFFHGAFVGVIEAKAQLNRRDTVSLSFVETSLFEYCKQQQLRYYLALGSQTDKLTGKFEGALDLCQVAAQDIFTTPTSWSTHVICTKKMKNLINLQQSVL